MSNLLFLYSNLLDSANLTASSEATGFPAANLKNPFRSKTWKTEGSTPGVAQLVIDHGSAKAVNCIALTGYSWLTAPGKLVMEFNDTNVWTSPAATETLTWVSGTTPGGNKGTILLKLSTTRTYRYNRLRVASASGVTLTAAASGSSGIMVADNNNIDFGTGNFTLVWKGSLPDWTADYVRMLDKASADESSGYYFRTGPTNNLNVRAGTGSLSGTAVHNFTNNSVHELVAVMVRESASVAGSITIYADGVLFDTITITAGSPTSVSTDQALEILGYAGSRVAGTCSFAATYNRALSAADALDLNRNGIAEADKWGSQTELVTGTIASWVNGTINSYNDSGDLSITATAGGQYCELPVANAPMTIGKKYRVSCEIANIVGAWGIGQKDATSQGDLVLSGSTYVREIIAVNSGGLRITSSSANSSGDFSNFSLVQIGATIALEEEGIQIANWQDSSTNNLDATYPVAGCTPNAPGDWDLGRLYIGECFEPARTYGWGYSESVVDPSLISQTLGGQDHADEIERYRVISVNGIIITQAQWVLYQAMINAVGTRKPIFVAFDYAGEPAERTLYGKFSQVPAITRPYLFEYSFEFTESR